MDIVDDAWRKDKLPEEDIAVPLSELPDPESDNGESYLENFENFAIPLISDLYIFWKITEKINGFREYW